MAVQRIAVVPSVRLTLFVCATHFFAVALLWLAPMPVPGQAGLTLAIAASLVFLLARDALLRTGRAIVALEIHDDGTISYKTRRGEWVECDLLGSTYVSAPLTIVQLRPRGRRGRRHVVLVPDNVDARDFRRLRIWLRWKQDEAPESVHQVEP